MVKTNHELAREYELKLKALGIPQVLKYRLIDNDEVVLLRVTDYESTGRFVVPSFITCASLKGQYGWTNILQPFVKCKFTEIYVDNRVENIFDATGLCMGMESKRISLRFRNPNKVNSIRMLFRESRLAEEIELNSFKNNRELSLARVFEGCTHLKRIKMPELEIGPTYSIEGMFSNCKSLEEIDLRNINLDKLIIMHSAIQGCYGLKRVYMRNTRESRVIEMKRALNNNLRENKVEVITQ